MKFLSARAKRVLAGIVAVPVVGVVGTGAYVTYRVNTRPPEHTFKPLVASDGSLLLEDCAIPPPTRWDLVMRAVRLVQLFLPLVVRWLFVYTDEAYEQWLLALLKAVQRAGPAFVKAGQWACTRSDLFDARFRRIFGRLFCEVDIHPFHMTQRVIEEDFGTPLSEVFQHLEETPLGSGSIGQVHDATLLNGDHVVVKVMHPHVVECIAKDFFLINTVARLANKYIPSLQHWEVERMALAWTNHLAAQLDFRIEAEHLCMFRQHFNGTDYANFPEPLRATQRVLIETFAPGEPATEEVLRSFEPHIRDVIASKGLNVYCKMLLRDNFIHGDMHPGNILIDGRDPHHPVVTMIDVGLCQKLTHREGDLSHDLMASFVHWDPTLCANTLLNMSSSHQFSDEERFRSDLSRLFKMYRPMTGNEEGCVENILQELFEATRCSRVTLDPAFSSLMWSILVLEGFIVALNPEYNMVRHAGPWLVSEGHLTWKLVKDVFYSGTHQAKGTVMHWRSKLLGRSDEPYVPVRRKRFEVAEE